LEFNFAAASRSTGKSKPFTHFGAQKKTHTPLNSEFYWPLEEEVKRWSMGACRLQKQQRFAYCDLLAVVARQQQQYKQQQ